MGRVVCHGDEGLRAPVAHGLGVTTAGSDQTARLDGAVRRTSREVEQEPKRRTVPVLRHRHRAVL